MTSDLTEVSDLRYLRDTAHKSRPVKVIESNMKNARKGNVCNFLVQKNPRNPYQTPSFAEVLIDLLLEGMTKQNVLANAGVLDPRTLSHEGHPALPERL